jgi:hypothetical protein
MVGHVEGIRLKKQLGEEMDRDGTTCMRPLLLAVRKAFPDDDNLGSNILAVNLWRNIDSIETLNPFLNMKYAGVHPW